MWCETVSDFSRLSQLAPEWQRWAEAAPGASVFQTWNWAHAFYKGYGDTVSLSVRIVRDKDRPIGIIPLVLRGENLEFLGSPDSDYNDILCDEKDAAVVLDTGFKSLFHSSSSWRSCLLDNLASTSRIVRYLPALSSDLRRHLHQVYRYPSPTIILDVNKTAVLGKLMKKRDLKNHYKKLQARGSLVSRHIESRTEIRRHLPIFFDQHITRFAANGLRSQFLLPETRRFYEAMIEEFDPTRELRFAVLELDGHPVAYHLGFYRNRKFIHYKPTFDIDYWDYSPGDSLLRYLFQYAEATDLDEFDFSVGDETYKSRFANVMKQNFAIHVDRDPDGLPERFDRQRRRVTQAVRQRPELRDFLKGSASRLRKTTRAVRCDPVVIKSFRTIGSLLREAIWKQDRVLYFRSPAVVSTRNNVVLRRTSLKEIARLALRFSDYLDVERLREFRTRLKRGHSLFVADDGGESIALFWVARADQTNDVDLSSKSNLPIRPSALVVYEISSGPRLTQRTASPSVLRALAIEFPHDELWIRCLGTEKTLQCNIERAGFCLRHRFTRRVLFHGLRSVTFDETPRAEET